MSIKLRYNCQKLSHIIVKMITSFLLLIPILDSYANDEKPLENTVQPRYQYQAYYLISLGHIPIGVAAISTENQTTNIPNETMVKIIGRMGPSPITSNFYVHTQRASPNTNEEPFYVQQKMTSFADASDHMAKGSLFSNDIIFNSTHSFKTKLKNLFFEPDHALFLNQTLTPFPQDFFNFQNAFEAAYDSNHFLKKATLTLNNDLTMTIKEISRNEYISRQKKLQHTRLDIGLMASFDDQMDEVERLSKTLSLCQTDMKTLTNSILKQLPYESYLIYRRMINLNKFCHALEKSISTQDISDAALLTKQHVLHFMSEDPLEIPHSVSKFSEKTLYYNENLMFLWPRLTTLMIQDSINEMKNLFHLDLNRKSLLGIQLRIKSLQPRSVVRADITQINAFIDFKIEKKSQKPYLLNATTLANNTTSNLKEMCKKYDGKIGLDLTDTKQIIVNSFGIRGVWDIPTKLKAARLFALQALSEKQCKTIYFNANPNLYSVLNHELNILKKESLSKESSLLLPNYGIKRLWVMPGKYRLTISSVKKEKVISVQEFTVGEQTKTNIIANVQ